MSRVLVIGGWDSYQHYKDRDPPWIKLYRDLLTSESWVMGTDDSRLVQVASMLLAARYHNATPLNFTLFRKVASLDMDEATFHASLAHLEATKFLEIQEEKVACKHGASKTLASCTSEAEQSRAEAEAEQRLRSDSVGTFSTSYSERASKTLSKSARNRNAVAAMAAAAIKGIPQ